MMANFTSYPNPGILTARCEAARQSDLSAGGLNAGDGH